MPEPYCPNYSKCTLVNSISFDTGDKDRLAYIEDYCRPGLKGWAHCRRFQCREKLHFCPDFVLPDSNLSFEDIIDRF